MVNNNKDMSNEQIYEFFRSRGYNVAANYRQRARKIVEQLLSYMKAIAGLTRWKKPSQEMIESFIDELPGILNWSLEGVGHKKRYCSLPLTEEQMLEVEQNLAGKKATFIQMDGVTAFCIEPTDNKNSNKGDN